MWALNTYVVDTPLAPVHFRIHFKLLFVFKAIKSLAALYLSKTLTILH